ncbi:MAG TPA: cyclic nucleotide-binding domain-containing protein [Bacillota bacterium]|nr:cyclic nucleotide-binding domain-containing protein [Bacillota bacterium]
MSEFPTQKYSKGETIFEENTAATVAYILEEGSVEISATRSGHRLSLAILEPGAIFGEMALVLSDQKRTATATALEDCEVTVIEKSMLYKYLLKASPVIRRLISDLIDRLDKTTSMLVETDDLSNSFTPFLRLLAKYGVSEIDYYEAVKTYSQGFGIESALVVDTLEQLAKCNFLEFSIQPDGQKVIRTHKKE